ncbi:XK-related protein 7-like, partial [Oculina patagonica]
KYSIQVVQPNCASCWSILSFADPITDILTIVDFYRRDHKIWFGVGLTFVILPCFVFLILYLVNNDGNPCSGTRCTQTILCGFHPFSAALVRLQALVFYIKKWWRDDEVDSASQAEAVDLLLHIDLAVLFESVVETAPQFIFQLYVVIVQEKQADVIKIISLPVSFLSLVWAFTAADQTLHRSDIGYLEVKHKLVFFVTHIFLLSSRLVAVCYFTVSCKWWVIGVVLFHTFSIVTTDAIWLRSKGECGFACLLLSLLHFFFVQWLRDDYSQQYIMYEGGSENNKAILKRMQVLSNVLFVLENFFMILFYYFSQYSNTWYSLPVTVCVCLFSVLGSVMRVIHFRVLLKKSTIVPWQRFCDDEAIDYDL